MDRLAQPGPLRPAHRLGVHRRHGNPDADHGPDGGPGRDLAGFLDWLATEKAEQVLDLDADADFTHVYNLVAVDGNQVRLLRAPHRIVVLERPAQPLTG